MKTNITNVGYCRQGSHIVPRELMTKLRSDDGKSERDCCQDCRKEATDRRAEIKVKART